MTRVLPALVLCALAVHVHVEEPMRGEWAVQGGFLFGAAQEYVLNSPSISHLNSRAF
jgi:hypothetical protein